MAVKKLAQRLREHDWFAACVEVLIVIVGILIALQVSDWNRDRPSSASSLTNRPMDFATTLASI